MRLVLSILNLKWWGALDLDFHIVLTLLLRSWSIAAGGITAILIPIFLNPSQQGYYYTFSAVIATQVFFELGLNHVLTQFAGHAAAHLHRVSKTKFDGAPQWRYAIYSLIRLAAKWNAVMATLFFFVLLIGGYCFFSDKGTLPPSQWMPAWIIVAIATAVNLALGAQLAICEGIGEVGQVARLRLIQSIFGYSILWFLLARGLGLWASIALPLSSAIGSVLWISQRRLLKSLDIIKKPEEFDDHIYGYSYRRDIFPLQWRIAASWASGYFIFSFLTPVVFALQGEVAAGRLGLGLTIFSAISTVGISWISAKIPAFSAHIARKERLELNALFDRHAVHALSVTVIFVALFLLMTQIVGYYEPKVLYRLPSLPALLLLATVTIVNSIIFSMAAYMRSHKEEPLLANSVISAFLIAGGVYAMAHVGLTATVAIYAAITVFIILPWCAWLFVQYRRRPE